ncbi:MAG: hypothetical protein KIT31_33045, partial [Deltaproteobacteria bacterium]|nr:hypothetical protein [Deltaproteobacteria bacterium]
TVPADGYELTVLGPTSASVELAGGKGMGSPLAHAPAPFERRITGRVLDDAGKPVAGAVVLVGERLDAFRGAFHGAAGAKTGADGAFSVATSEDTAGFALALHPRGWSNVASYPAGRGDAAIALTAGTSGTIAAHVTRAGAPREGSVILTMPGGVVRMSLATDAAGELRVPLLAPGTYHLDVRPAVGYLDGTSRPSSHDVTVVRGRATDVHVALASGTKLLLSAFKPGMFTVEYFVYPGTEPLSLDELKKRSRGGAVPAYLLGGVDAERAAQIHDVTPGTYTVCVDAATRDAHYPMACRRIDVGGDAPSLEIAVDVKTD